MLAVSTERAPRIARAARKASNRATNRRVALVAAIREDQTDSSRP